jgi:hypothetical protein
LQKFVIYGRKSFVTLGPGLQEKVPEFRKATLMLALEILIGKKLMF